MGSDDGEGGGGSDSVSSGGSRGRENSLSGGDSGSDPHGGGGDGHAELDASGAAGAQGNETDELTPPRKRSHFGDGDDAAAAGNGGAGPTTETTGHGGYDADGASTAHASGDVGEFGDAGAERTVSSAGSFAESRASSPMQLHDDDDDAYVSDQEPLPPVPHAPRHPTQGADDDPRPMLPPRALEDGEAVEDGELAAALSPPIDLGDHSSSAAPSAFPSRAPSEAGDMRVGDDATDTGRRASRAAGGLGGLATNGSAPVSRAGSDTDIRGSHRDDGMAEPGSRAGSSSAAARGHSANSAVESNQYVPNSPYSIPPGGSLKSPESRPMSTTSRREHVRFVGCSSHTEYEIQKKIGEGTFGEVTIGRHKSTGDVVALKKILVHNEREGIPITALREIKILKALSHENIISLREIAYKAGDRPRRERGTVYMVFPYMDHDLTGLLENPQVRFTPPQIKSFMRQLLLGVEYMHKNMILHRDMKGSNILLDNQGHLKIGDFGLARTITVPADPSQVKPYTNMVVTRWYRPPELLLGETFYSKPIDMWGVGCVFGEMLRRKPILAGANDPDQLEKIFALCGTPDETSWPDYRRYLEKSNIQGFRTIHKRSIHEKFPPNHYDRHTVSLIDHLLVLDPAKRLSATQALEHDYFFVYPKAAVPGTSE
nr:serine/threonine protein kinase, CMGC, CDC2/CDK sub [Polyrhizophydium stewartii]